MKEEIIYEVGCGSKKIYPSSIGVDKIRFPGVSIVWDLNKYPWPIQKNSADRIIIFHVLEHLNDFLQAMEEIYRILKPEGIVEIRVPHFGSSAAWTDPTHKHAFGVGTFFYFDPSHPFYGFYGKSPKWPKFKVIKRELNYLNYSLKPSNIFSGIIIKGANRLANFAPYPFERYIQYYIGGIDELYFRLQKR